MLHIIYVEALLSAMAQDLEQLAVSEVVKKFAVTELESSPYLQR